MPHGACSRSRSPSWASTLRSMTKHGYGYQSPTRVACVPPAAGNPSHDALRDGPRHRQAEQEVEVPGRHGFVVGHLREQRGRRHLRGGADASLRCWWPANCLCTTRADSWRVRGQGGGAVMPSARYRCRRGRGHGRGRCYRSRCHTGGRIRGTATAAVVAAGGGRVTTTARAGRRRQ